MMPEPRAHDGEQALGGERLSGLLQGSVERIDIRDKPWVVDVRFVHGPADRALVQHVRPEVEHPLAEP